MGQFVMWRDFFLTHGADDLLTTRYPFLSFASLDLLEMDVGVPDDLWKSQEADPSSPLFEYAQMEGSTE
jgi:hypothetical protein